MSTLFTKNSVPLIRTLGILAMLWTRGAEPRGLRNRSAVRRWTPRWDSKH